jgi:hypothetical protein
LRLSPNANLKLTLANSFKIAGLIKRSRTDSDDPVSNIGLGQALRRPQEKAAQFPGHFMAGCCDANVVS